MSKDKIVLRVPGGNWIAQFTVEEAEAVIAELSALVAETKKVTRLPKADAYQHRGIVGTDLFMVEVPNRPGYYIATGGGYENARAKANSHTGLPLSYWVSNYGPDFVPINFVTKTVQEVVTVEEPLPTVTITC